MRIELVGIEKSFGKQVILSQLDISISSGEMVLITGKSGSGKTTLLNIMGLIERKDKGDIIYDDQVITNERQKRKLLSENIGFIFQNYGLVENETVYENLSVVKRLYENRKKVRYTLMYDALLQVGLNEQFLGKKVYECSGGEQQRIAIAKMLLKNCDVIFADEPTASLDDENKINVLEHLKSLHKLGKTIIMVSHDKDICDYCNRMITLHFSGIVSSGKG